MWNKVFSGIIFCNWEIGLFTEFGADLALAQLRGTPKIYAVGDEAVKPAAMFHYHPLIVWKGNIEEVLAEFWV